jgi:hypothetical protein
MFGCAWAHTTLSTLASSSGALRGLRETHPVVRVPADLCAPLLV